MTIAAQLLEQGRSEGRVEGRQEGRVEGRREALLGQIRRFEEILGIQSEIAALSVEELEARAAELTAEIASRLK